MAAGQRVSAKMKVHCQAADSVLLVERLHGEQLRSQALLQGVRRLGPVALLRQHGTTVWAMLQVNCLAKQHALLVAECRCQLAQLLQRVVHDEHGEALWQGVLLPVVRLPLGEECRRAIVHGLQLPARQWAWCPFGTLQHLLLIDLEAAHAVSAAGRCKGAAWHRQSRQSLESDARIQ